MGWGQAFRDALHAASDAAKAAAQKAASTAQSVYQKGRQLAGEAVDWVQSETRDAERAVADRGFDMASHAVTSVREAYHDVKAWFGAKPVGSPVQPCPGLTNDGTADPDRDGWLMSPQGPGKPCIAIPPGPSALGDARAKAAVADDPCCLAKRAGQPPRDIIYVNGINTTATTQCDTLNQIAQQACGRVVGVYNATEGMALDAIQTGQDRRLIKAAAAGKAIPTFDGRNPAVDTLTKAIEQDLRAGHAPEVWAHSQGGAVLSLALYQAKNDRTIATGNEDPLAGMVVKSLGAAAPKWTDGPAYQHFVHINDATPALFGLGRDGDGKLADAGRNAKIVRFSGDPASKVPFLETPDLDWFPAATSNHDVEKSYLRMEKQVNGGCP